MVNGRGRRKIKGGEMKAQVHQETRSFIYCPVCNKEKHSVDHILDTKSFKSLWYCNSLDCAARFSIKWDGFSFELEPTGEYSESTLSLLLVKDQTLIIAETIGSDPDYYEQHTCPSNVFRDCIEVIRNNEFDSHDVFKLLESIPRPKAWNGKVFGLPFKHEAFNNED